MISEVGRVRTAGAWIVALKLHRLRALRPILRKACAQGAATEGRGYQGGLLQALADPNRPPAPSACGLSGGGWWAAKGVTAPPRRERTYLLAVPPFRCRRTATWAIAVSGVVTLAAIGAPAFDRGARDTGGDKLQNLEPPPPPLLRVSKHRVCLLSKTGAATTPGLRRARSLHHVGSRGFDAAGCAAATPLPIRLRG